MADVRVHDLTVGEYLETWLSGKHALKPSTQHHYRDALRLYLIPHLGHIRLLDLRAHHLDRFYAAITIGKRGRPLSPSSIRRVHAALRSALNTAVKRRLIPYNPAEHVELAPENPKRPKPWTLEQCRAFLDHIADDRLAVLYHLCLVTGMRRGEIAGLRWVDVDFDGRCLFVVQQIVDVRGQLVIGTPKTRKSARVLPLDEFSFMMICRHQEAQALERAAWGVAWQESGLVFTREDGRPLRPEFITRHFQALAEKAGLPRIRLHDLRHTNASMALAAGVELKVISERLGHSTLGITADLYTHVVPTVGRAAADRIGETFAPTAKASTGDVVSALLARDARKWPERRGDDVSLQVDGARPKVF